MKKSMSEYEELFDSLGDDNPLVDSFRIKIKDISLTSETVTLINELDHIYSIRAPYDFVNILTEMKKIITLVAICDHYSACYSIYGYYFKYNQSKRICEKK